MLALVVAGTTPAWGARPGTDGPLRPGLAAAAGPEETPTPTPSPEPTPGPTPSPEPSPSPAPSPTPSPEPSPDPGEPSDDPSKDPDEDPDEGGTPPAPPPPTGRAVGRVVDAKGVGIGRAKVAVFDREWRWLREVTARPTGRFTLTLPPGLYRLQSSDSRPAWRTDRRAPADATVEIRDKRDSILTMTLRRGAHVTGTVTQTRRDRPAARALVRATDEVGRNFDVRTDGRGQFALGGLPRGTYRLWGYDRGRRWVGRTVKVGWLDRGDGRHVRVRMRTKAGGVNGYVMEGPRIARATTWVTAISRRTGQWWVVKARSGDLALRGLAPGRYTFVVTGTQEWQGRTIRPRRKVVAGRTHEMTLKLNRRT